ncbi:hypothetical protein PENCOP_c002G04923 [Penicillium coprophilum]|uniref:Uncharacterized protein n=1 Tax=Penicillium coprophilum TaxID=36646 RepID=A0A1V6V0E5_9EURO|nr:hypothetical protein PENCOP_c002G04923 [Penicillium coprophilum]
MVGDAPHQGDEHDDEDGELQRLDNVAERLVLGEVDSVYKGGARHQALDALRVIGEEEIGPSDVDEPDGLVVDGGQVATKLGVAFKPDLSSSASVPGNDYGADAHLARRGLSPGEAALAALVILDGGQKAPIIAF